MISLSLSLSLWTFVSTSSFCNGYIFSFSVLHSSVFWEDRVKSKAVVWQHWFFQKRKEERWGWQTGVCVRLERISHCSLLVAKFGLSRSKRCINLNLKRTTWHPPADRPVQQQLIRLRMPKLLPRSSKEIHRQGGCKETLAAVAAVATCGCWEYLQRKSFVVSLKSFFPSATGNWMNCSRHTLFCRKIYATSTMRQPIVTRKIQRSILPRLRW